MIDSTGNGWSDPIEAEVARLREEVERLTAERDVAQALTSQVMAAAVIAGVVTESDPADKVDAVIRKMADRLKSAEAEVARLREELESADAEVERLTRIVAQHTVENLTAGLTDSKGRSWKDRAIEMEKEVVRLAKWINENTRSSSDRRLEALADAARIYRNATRRLFVCLPDTRAPAPGATYEDVLKEVSDTGNTLDWAILCAARGRA